MKLPFTLTRSVEICRQRIQFVEVLHLNYYNYNGLPDEFTTIQAQIEMYLLNLTRAYRKLRGKYLERNVSNKLSLFGMKLIPRRKEIHFRRK